MIESKENELVEELRRITKLLALIATKDKSQKEKIALLSEVDFQPKEIAELIGTTPNTVSVVLSKIRKEAKAGKKSRTNNKA